MSVASFIASQRAEHGIPHAKCCRFLGLSESWFYKWHDRPPTKRQRRRQALDAQVERIFEDSGGNPRTHGSPGSLPSSSTWAGGWPRRRWPTPWPARASWPGPHGAFGP